jgi:hypothetical protein
MRRTKRRGTYHYIAPVLLGFVAAAVGLLPIAVHLLSMVADNLSAAMHLLPMTMEILPIAVDSLFPAIGHHSLVELLGRGAEGFQGGLAAAGGFKVKRGIACSRYTLYKGSIRRRDQDHSVIVIGD